MLETPRSGNMHGSRILLLIGSLLLVPPPLLNAGEFQYQFQDKPYAEADVMVVSHEVIQGPGGELYLRGRLFNRGIKPARNVRVVYSIRNKYGASISTNPIHLSPSEVPPASFADFEERIPFFFDPRDFTVYVTAEWEK